MGKASSNKKVLRAASTGGGRTSRGSTPWGWYSVIAVAVILGTVGIVFSRQQTQDRFSASGGDRPKVSDHWHAALGVYICDRFLPNVPDSHTDPVGIHTHGDGVIHIHPFTRAASGRNAQMKVFARTVGMTLDTLTLRFPGDKKTYKDGSTKCGDKVGHIEWFVDTRQQAGNPADYHFAQDRQLIVIAFVAKGTDVPKVPPSASELLRLSDVTPTPTPLAPTTPPSAPPASTSTTARR